MSDKLKLFTKILMAEIEDLEDDLEAGERQLDERHREEKITEYVYMQNRLVIRQELAGIHAIASDLSRFPPASMTGLDEIRNYYLGLLMAESTEYEFQRAVTEFVTARINRVYDYLKG